MADIVIDHEFIMYYTDVLMKRNSDMLIWSWIDYNKSTNELVVEILPKEKYSFKQMANVKRSVAVLLNSAMDNGVYANCSLSVCGHKRKEIEQIRIF